jgi:hypothetical protein
MKKMANGLSTCCLTIAPRESTFQSHRPEVNIRVTRNNCKIGSGILFDALTAIQFDPGKTTYLAAALNSQSRKKLHVSCTKHANIDQRGPP